MKLFMLAIVVFIIPSQASVRRTNCNNYFPRPGKSTTPTSVPEGTTTTSPGTGKRTTAKFECVEDWGVVCTKDDQCCSKVCLKPFCKIMGIPETTRPSKNTTFFSTKRTTPTVVTLPTSKNTSTSETTSETPNTPASNPPTTSPGTLKPSASTCCPPGVEIIICNCQ